MVRPRPMAPLTRPNLIVLSLGGGVQSTALALMADAGMFHAKPDVAYFADTRWEPDHVYATVEAVRNRVGFDVETVSNGRSLPDDVRAGNAAGGNNFTPIPLFNSNGSQSVRQCTSQYKIDPINQAMRRRLGYRKGERVTARNVRVEQWMGISVDEFTRAKDNRLKYVTNRYPLIDARISRADCAQWLAAHHPDIPIGKSACKGCPYKTKAAWVRLARDDPDGFQEAVDIDRALRTPGHNEMRWRGGLSYLHQSRRPLDEAVAMPLATAELFPDDGAGICDSGHCFT